MSRVGDFHHLMFQVTDLNRSERFYRDVLGLEPLGGDLWPEARPNITFKTDAGNHIVLIQVPKVHLLGPWSYTHFQLSPDEWRAAEARLRAGGACIDEAPGELHPVGELELWAQDPDGHVLQFRAQEPRAYEVPPARRGKIVAGRVEDFPIGSVTRIPQGKFFVVRFEEGILALSEVCTHRQFTVQYRPERHGFLCPLHRCQFTQTGRVIRCFAGAVGSPPLHAYPTEIADGRVVVDTDTSIARQPGEADRMLRIPRVP